MFCANFDDFSELKKMKKQLLEISNNNISNFIFYQAQVKGIISIKYQIS